MRKHPAPPLHRDRGLAIVAVTLAAVGACTSAARPVTSIALELPLEGTSGNSHITVELTADGAEVDFGFVGGSDVLLSASVPVGATIDLVVAVLRADENGYTEFTASQSFVAQNGTPIVAVDLARSPERSVSLRPGFTDSNNSFAANVVIPVTATDVSSGLPFGYTAGQTLTFPQGRSFSFAAVYAGAAGSSVPGRGSLAAAEAVSEVLVAFGPQPVFTPVTSVIPQGGIGLSTVDFSPNSAFSVECAYLSDSCDQEIDCVADDSLEWVPCDQLSFADPRDQDCVGVLRYADVRNVCVDFTFAVDRTPPAVTVEVNPGLAEVMGGATTSPISLVIRPADPADPLEPASVGINRSGQQENLCGQISVDQGIVYCTDIFQGISNLSRGIVNLEVTGRDPLGNAFPMQKISVSLVGPVSGQDQVAISGIEIYPPQPTPGGGEVFLGLQVNNRGSAACSVEVQQAKVLGFARVTTLMPSVVAGTVQPGLSTLWLRYDNMEDLDNGVPQLGFNLACTCCDTTNSPLPVLLDLPMGNRPLQWLADEVVLPSYSAKDHRYSDLPIVGGRSIVDVGPAAYFGADDENLILSRLSSFSIRGFVPQSNDSRSLTATDAHSSAITQVMVLPSPSLVTWTRTGIDDHVEGGPSTAVGPPANLGAPVSLLWDPMRDLIIAVSAKGWQTFDGTAASLDVPCGGTTILDAKMTGVDLLDPTALPRVAMLVRNGSTVTHCEVNPGSTTVVRQVQTPTTGCVYQKLGANITGDLFTGFGTAPNTVSCAEVYSIRAGVHTVHHSQGDGQTGASPLLSAVSDPFARLSATVDSVGGARVLRTPDSVSFHGQPADVVDVHLGPALQTAVSVSRSAVGAGSLLALNAWHHGNLNRPSARFFQLSEFVGTSGALAIATTSSAFHEANQRLYAAMTLADGDQEVFTSRADQLADFTFFSRTDLNADRIGPVFTTPVMKMLIRGPRLVGVDKRRLVPGDVATVTAVGLSGQDDRVVLNGIEIVPVFADALHLSFRVPTAFGAMGGSRPAVLRVVSHGRLSGPLRSKAAISPAPWQFGIDAANPALPTLCLPPCAAIAVDDLVLYNDGRDFSLAPPSATSGLFVAPFPGQPMTSRFDSWFLSSGGGFLFSHSATTGGTAEAATLEATQVSLPVSAQNGETYLSMAHDQREVWSAVAFTRSNGSAFIRLFNSASLVPSPTPDLPIGGGNTLAKMAFAPYGTKLYLATTAGEVRVLDLATGGQAVVDVSDAGDCAASPAAILDLAPQGGNDDMVLLTSSNSTFSIWTIDGAAGTMACSGSETVPGPVSAGQVAPSGTYIYIGSVDNLVTAAATDGGFHLFRLRPELQFLYSHTLLAEVSDLDIAQGPFSDSLTSMNRYERSNTVRRDTILHRPRTDQFSPHRVLDFLAPTAP